MNYFSYGDIGSLDWVKRTGGVLKPWEKIIFVGCAMPPLFAAFLRMPFLPAAPRIDLEKLAPPNTALVNEAKRILKETSPLPMLNHSYRTGYWALAVMLRQGVNLSDVQIEEAWVAALLHDVGLDRPAPSADFTLGGAAMAEELAKKFGWPAASARTAAEAITVNPNGYVNRKKFGDLAWAMNVGGYAETAWGPYRSLMHPADLAVLEKSYPRQGFHKTMREILDKEFSRFPNQRYRLLDKIGFVALRLKDG